MMQNKWISVLLILFLLSFSLLSECPPDCADPLTFDYSGGDYQEIDWSTFPEEQWLDIPLERIEEIPPLELDYQFLDTEQRWQMSSEQISANLEKIENLATDVNPEQALEAIYQSTGVSVVSLGERAWVDNNVLQAAAGAFDFAGKSGWEIEVSAEGRIFVLQPPEIKAKQITSAEIFTLRNEVTYTTSTNVALKVSGLSIERGQLMVRQGDTATIGDYSLDALDNPVNIYLHEEKEPQGNYVSLSALSLKIGTTTEGTVQVEPLPGNKLFSMVKREYTQDAQGHLRASQFTLIPDPQAQMTIFASGGNSLEVTSREEEGKTPLLKENGVGDLFISSGRLEIKVEQGNLKVTFPGPLYRYEQFDPPDLSNSVALELVSDSAQMQGSVLRTSSSNRFAFFQNGQEIAGTDQGLEVSDSLEVNLMKTREDLAAKYPKIKFILKPIRKDYYPGITANMAQATDQWLRDKPGIEQYLGGSFAEIRFSESGGSGFKPILSYLQLSERDVDPTTRAISGERVLTPFQIINHEFVHAVENLLWAGEQQKGVDKSPGNLYSLYQSYAESSLQELLNDPNFNSLVNEFNKYQSARHSGKWPLLETTAPLERSRLLTEMESYLRINQKYDLQTAVFYERWRDLISQKTGTTSYVFYVNTQLGLRYVEVGSTFSELPVEEARDFPYLAQLEYDRVLSTNPPAWLRQQAEQRYYAIMGGKEGVYCREHACGPCLVYTLTCKP